ncbi:hypothetical protein [Streptomyces sp. NPDC059224]|uniref:hypothetical protein n=1 Tax=Streptomyces sp. NPDC059224 TaxID=3346775 RepID=UPI0036B7B4C4
MIDGQDDVKDGLVFGHIDVRGPNAQASSRSRDKDGGLGIQVFVVLPDLLDGLGTLLRRGRGTFNFTDPMFSIKFKLDKRGNLTISHRRTMIDESTPEVVAEAVWSAAEEFTDRYLDHITEATDFTTISDTGEIQNVEIRPRVVAAMARFQNTLNNLKS